MSFWKRLNEWRRLKLDKTFQYKGRTYKAKTGEYGWSYSAVYIYKRVQIFGFISFWKHVTTFSSNKINTFLYEGKPNELIRFIDDGIEKFIDYQSAWDEFNGSKHG